MATTWSVWISCLAAAAICAGCVWSYWTNSLSGCPLTPPLALTHENHALIMFGPSLKSVPGCLVSIVPMLIGVPVAATPGFGPHDDVPLDAVLELEPPDVDDVALDPPPLADPPLELLLLLLLLPHAASNTAPMTAARAKPRRTRSAW